MVACRVAGDHPFSSDRYEVRAPVVADDYGYWQALNEAWNTSDVLVNVEHDMEFSDELVDGLVNCPHPRCTYPYRCWLKHHKHWVYTPVLDGHWIEKGVEWADTSTLGFIKIAPEARTQPLERMIWKFLEHKVCEATTGFSQIKIGALGKSVCECSLQTPEDTQRAMWHVHWPEVRHFHDYDSQVWAEASDWERFCQESGEPCLVMPSEMADDVRAIRLGTKV